MTGERNKIIWGEIVARAWRDEAYKQQLIANPKQVLSDAGMAVDEGVEVQIIEDTPTTRHLVFPVAPSGGQSLTEDQLELVAGGGSTATSTNEVQTAEVATTEVEATETTTTTTAEAEAEVVAVVAGVVVLI